MFFHDNGGSLLQIGNQRDCLTPLLLVREKYSQQNVTDPGGSTWIRRNPTQPKILESRLRKPIKNPRVGKSPTPGKKLWTTITNPKQQKIKRMSLVLSRE